MRKVKGMCKILHVPFFILKIQIEFERWRVSHEYSGLGYMLEVR